MADQAITINKSVVQVLPEELQASQGFTHVAEIDYRDFNGATLTTQGDTGTMDLGPTGANWLVSKAAILIETAFATTGTLTIEFGVDGDTDDFITAADAKTAGPIIEDLGGSVATGATTAAAASDNLVVRLTTQAATGALADITAGKAKVYFSLANL